MKTIQANPVFRFFPQLNRCNPQQKKWLNSSSRLFASAASTWFAGNSLQNQLVTSIAAHRLLPIKEVLESFEMFARIRKHVRGQHVADLCCGHGLLGVLFAIFERGVQHVHLIDRTQPDSRARLIALATDIAPWIPSKIQNHQTKINALTSNEDNWFDGLLPSATTIISAHACGVLSDYCIDAAIHLRGPLAILPCCYPRSTCPAPLALQTALGLKAAYDVDRTYRLHRADYHIRWDAIPTEITPMNRILCARPKTD